MFVTLSRSGPWAPGGSTGFAQSPVRAILARHHVLQHTWGARYTISFTISFISTKGEDLLFRTTFILLKYTKIP